MNVSDIESSNEKASSLACPAVFGRERGHKPSGLVKLE
jgi:hypothetical protein